MRRKVIVDQRVALLMSNMTAMNAMTVIYAFISPQALLCISMESSPETALKQVMI